MFKDLKLPSFVIFCHALAIMYYSFFETEEMANNPHLSLQETMFCIFLSLLHVQKTMKYLTQQKSLSCIHMLFHGLSIYQLKYSKTVCHLCHCHPQP